MNSEAEVAAARRKLQRLEGLYAAYRAGSAEPEHVREWTMQSLADYIKQFKEEIIRFECRRPMKRLPYLLKNETEAANTRAKLQRLEALYDEAFNETTDQDLRRMTLGSLRRMMKQLKEELIRYETRQGKRVTSPSPLARVR